MNTASQFFIVHDDGAVPRWPDAARREGRVVRQHRFAKERLRDGSTEQIRNLSHLSARVQSALSDQDRNLPPTVQHIGGGAKLIGRGLVDHGHPRGRRSRARIVHGAVVCNETHHLSVLGHGEMGDPAIAECYAAGAVRHQHGVFRSGHFDIVERDVLHQLRRVDALLVARPDQVMKRHAGNRHNRRAVHVRVV
jgi:hypothetical protein